LRLEQEAQGLYERHSGGLVPGKEPGAKERGPEPERFSPSTTQRMRYLVY
jgi:hypothetical protein